MPTATLHAARPGTAGDLRRTLSNLVHEYLAGHGEDCDAALVEAIGALERVKLELIPHSLAADTIDPDSTSNDIAAVPQEPAGDSPRVHPSTYFG